MIHVVRFERFFSPKLVLGLLGLLLGAQALAAQVMVTDIKGRVTMNGQALVILAELEFGSALTLDKNAALTLVYLKDGAEYQLHGASQVLLAASGPSAQGGKISKRSSLLATTTAQKTAPGWLTDAAQNQKLQGAIVMRGDGSEGLQPQEKTLALQPTFVWPAPESKTTRTTFKLFEADQEVPLFVKELSGQQLRLPAALRLHAGASYNWSIQQSDGGRVGPVLSASFTLASAEEIAYFEQIRPHRKASFSDRLLYANLLQKAQFTAEAQHYWQQLAKERPGVLPLAELAAP